MAEGALRELLAHFEVEVEDEKLDKFEEHLEHFKHGLERVGERMAEVFAIHELKEFIFGTVEAGAHLQDLSEQLGLSTEELQKFQFAAKLGGVEGEQAAHSLGLFVRQLGEAGMGGGEAAKTLNTLGVKAKGLDGHMRPVLDILGDVSDKMVDMDPSQRAATAMRLFGRAGLAMVPVLKDGREGLEQLYKEFDDLGGGMGKDFVEEAKKADDEISKLKLGWTSLKSSLVRSVLPTLLKVVDTIKGWTKYLVTVSEKTHVMEHIFDAAKIYAAYKAISAVVTIMRALAAGEGLVDLLNPFTMMIVGAAALFLVFDDLMTMMEGGNSVIGDALGPDKQAMIDSLRESFEEMKTTWQEMEPDLEAIGGDLLKIGIEVLPILVEVFAKLVAVAADAVHMIGNVARAMSDLKSGKFSSALADILERNPGTNDSSHAEGTGDIRGAEYSEEGGGLAKLGPNGSRTPFMGSNFMGPQQTLPPASYVSAPSFSRPGAPAGPSQVTINQTNKIDIKHTGNETSEKVAGDIGRSTKKELDKVLTNTLNAGKKQ